MPLQSQQNAFGKDIEDLNPPEAAETVQELHFAPIDQSWGYSDPTETDKEIASQSKSKSPTFPIVRRISLDQVASTVNTDHSMHIQNEFGRANQPGGKFSIIPLETQIKVNYLWDLDTEKLGEEKIVSLPFGPKNWAWQIM
jgi:hypothetical protein